jgi:F-type H+-transporting ATPase subunit b
MSDTATQTATLEAPAPTQGILGTFGIKPSLFIAQLINFAIVLFILKKWVFTPLLKTMDERRRVIDEGLKHSEEAEKIHAQAKEDENRILRDARVQGQEIVEQLKEQGEKEKQLRILTSNEIIARQLKEAKELAVAEAEEEKNRVRTSAVDLIMAGIERVAGSAIDPKQHGALIDEAIEGFEKQHVE